MATILKLRKLLHRKAWEACTSLPVVTAIGAFTITQKYNIAENSFAVLFTSAASVLKYEGSEDAWSALPASGATGTFSAGSCGEVRDLGAIGGVFTQTSVSGTTTSITTNKTIVKSLAGKRIRVVEGAGVGYDSVITSNTIGANSVLTLPINGVAFDATTKFQIFSGSIWFFNAGTTAVGFTSYDFSTNVWTARSVTNLPVLFGTTGQLISTPASTGFFATGTATSAASTTLTNSGKAWQVNMFANFQIRITGGTGAGQIRIITSNTATAVTVPAWTVIPDATSTYNIEGNEDVFYLFGNNAVTVYKFLVSTNTWSTLTPTVARAGGMAAGGSADWVDSVVGWDTETAVSHYTTLITKQNGRYIYSLRGGATSTLDVYDISANTWINAIAYAGQMETFTTGSHSVDYAGLIYIVKEATGRNFVFNIDKNEISAFATNTCQTALGGTAIEGDKTFFLIYKDGDTEIKFYYSIRHSSSDLVRMIVI